MLPSRNGASYQVQQAGDTSDQNQVGEYAEGRTEWPRLYQISHVDGESLQSEADQLCHEPKNDGSDDGNDHVDREALKWGLSWFGRTIVTGRQVRTLLLEPELLEEGELFLRLDCGIVLWHQRVQHLESERGLPELLPVAL